MKTIRFVFCIAVITASVSSCDCSCDCSTQDITKTYTWVYKTHTYNATLHFSQDDYYYYEGDEYVPPYSKYVRQEAGHEYLENVAQELYKNIEYDNFSNDEIAGYLLAFVQQCIPYKVSDIPPYPIVILCQGYGDCTSKSCLYASLLKAFNINCILLVLANHTHMAVAVDCPSCKAARFCVFHGRNFFYTETTESGWLIGQVPDESKKTSNVELLELEQTTSFQRSMAVNKTHS